MNALGGCQYKFHFCDHCTYINVKKKRYCYISFFVFSLPSGPLWCVASHLKNILGGGCRLLHGGVDIYLPVSVQKCFWAVQTDNGHVRGRVSRTVGVSCFFFLLILFLCFIHFWSRQVHCTWWWIFVWLSSLRDLGLERYDTVELFARILLPATFLLACILQLHYFNSDFLTLTDLDNVPVRENSRWGSKNACNGSKCVMKCFTYAMLKL